MNKKILLQYIFLLATFFSFGSVTFAFTINSDSSDLDVQLIVSGCNNNLICEAVIGEDVATCPLDCSAPTTPTTTDDVVNDGDDSRPGNRRNFEVQSQNNGSTGGQNNVNLYSNLTVYPGVSDVAFSWLTPFATGATIQIGLTPDFEKFSSSQFLDTTTHFFYFTDLISGQEYFYRIDSKLDDGTISSRFGSFRTRISTNTSASEDVDVSQGIVYPVGTSQVVKNLYVTKDFTDSYSEISWNNPEAPNFTGVTVVRTVGVPAQTKTDGIVVYQGVSETTKDSGILDNQIYFYTVFATYNNGSVSSGISVRFDTTRTNQDVVYGDQDFSLYDIIFSQNETTFRYGSDVLNVAPYVPIEIVFQKMSMFAPVDDIHLSVEAYRKDGTFISEESSKFNFDTTQQSYTQTYQSELDPGNVLFFSLLREGYADQKRLIGKMIVNEYSGDVGLYNNDLCLTSKEGIFALITAYFVCFYPIPQIILICSLIIVMYFLRKKVFTR